MKKNKERNTEKGLFKCFISTCTKFGRARDMFPVTFVDFISPYPGAPKIRQEFKNVLVCRACMREGGYEVVESLGKGTPRPKRGPIVRGKKPVVAIHDVDTMTAGTSTGSLTAA